ncbi:hypothetical protein H0H81_011158 [Sphagnurus paluster]|uniref:Uncharacterized protein n=1 Tax=Sphagnurus paluster TaxID=117069 RepID=A0A9P7FSI2_9AGAR|nr:hypothetical protein H0H81_011158 [Sphagnurus paluster]
MLAPDAASVHSSASSISRRISFSAAISAFGAKIARTLSQDDTTTLGGDAPAPVPPVLGERSLSRGREVYVRLLLPSLLHTKPAQSSGRGGAGNIHRASASKSVSPDAAATTPTRGREPVPAALKSPTPTQIFSTGRGGAGNIRSPSREPVSASAAVAEETVPARGREHHPFSTGRGGAGNIRSPSRDPAQAHIAEEAEAEAVNLGLTLEGLKLGGRDGRSPSASGRGRAPGTIVTSQSRSRSRGPPGLLSSPTAGSPSPAPATRTQSTGRGGAGNVRIREEDEEGEGAIRG